MALPGAALYGKNLAACSQLLQAEVLLDAIHETGAQLLLLAVHRKNRHLRAESNNEMAAVSRLECAALLLQPSLEFLTRTSSQTEDTTVVLRCQQMCCVERCQRAAEKEAIGLASASVFLVDLAERVRRPSRNRAGGS